MPWWVPVGVIVCGMAASFMGSDALVRRFRRGGPRLPSKRLPSDPVPRGEVVGTVMMIGGLAVSLVGGLLLVAWLVLLAV